MVKSYSGYKRKKMKSRSKSIDYEPKTTRRLSSKTFVLWSSYHDKRNALALQRRLKAGGNNARIITNAPRGRGATYHVYRQASRRKR